MFQKQVTFNYPMPLHTRPMTAIVKTAKEYTSTITATVGDKSGNMKSGFTLLTLEIMPGSIITVTAEGPDEEAAVQGVIAVIERLSDGHMYG